MKHSIFLNFFLLFCRVALLGSTTFMGDAIDDTTHEAQYPTPAQVLRQSRSGTDGDEDGEPRYKTEISFLHQELGEIITWGPFGVYMADIPIDRYFGTAAERQKMISLGIMDKTAKFYVPCYDCDSRAFSPGGFDINPQCDLVYLNGHYLGKMSGENAAVTMNTFDVPLEWIKFPSAPGNVANNRLEILVDTASVEPTWYLGQLWQMLVIQAPPPVLLVHGWTTDQDAMSEFSDHLTQELGIPSVIVDVSADDSPFTNAQQLQRDLTRLTAEWGVEQFNIVAHSKGGLDSRFLVDANGLASKQVFKVLQVATPNLGSLFADVALEPMDLKQRVYSWAAEHFQNATQASPSFTSLTVENCRIFNTLFDTPDCPLHTITGRVDHNDLSPSYRILANYVDLGEPNDGMVAVNSAHAIHRQISASPLYARGTSQYDHSGIIREGAPDVILAYADKLIEIPERDYEFPPYKDTTFAKSTRGDASQEADPQDVPTLNASMETNLFALEKGKIHECELHILSKGTANIALFPCARGTRAEIVVPGKESSISLTTDELPGIIAEDAVMLWADLSDATSGTYQLRIDCTQAENDAITKLLVKEENPVFVAEISVEASVPPSTRPLVTASCTYCGKCVADGSVNMILRATKSWVSSDVPLEFAMHDDGEDGDSVAHDGIYSVYFQPSEFGQWNLEVEGTGQFEGMALSRYATASTVVSDATGSFSTPLTETTVFPTGALRLPAFSFETEVTVSRAGRYSLSGKLVASDGTIVGSAGNQWVAEGAECQTRSLEFATDELLARKEDGPWTIQDLRLCLVDDGTDTAVPIVLSQSECIQQTNLTKYAELVKHEFSIRILGTGSERILDNEPAFSRVLEVRMDAEVTGSLPASLSFHMVVQPETGVFLGSATGELVATDDGFQIVAKLGSDAVQTLAEQNSFILQECQADFQDNEGNAYSQTVEGTYHTQEYSCAQFHMPAHVEDGWGVNGDCTIEVEDTPEEDGTYKIRIRFSIPEEEGQESEEWKTEDGDDGALRDNGEMYFVCLHGVSIDAFHLKDSFLDDSTLMCGEYVNVTGIVLQQLWGIGDCDGILDPGESLEITIYFLHGKSWNENLRITDWLVRRMAEYAPTGDESCLRVVHSLDANTDYAISRVELDTGKASWQEDEVHPQVLLEAIGLSCAEEYLYDHTTHRFYVE